MKTQNKILVGSIVITTISTSATVYNYNKIKDMKNENNKLNDRIENQLKNSKYTDIDTTYEDIKEINKKNVNLILYEAHSKGYSTTISDNRFIETIVKLDTSYKYTVTFDMSHSEVYKSGDRYIVSIDLSDIKLDTITIAPSNISYDLNLLNRWKGVTQADLTEAIIEKSCSDIEAKVNEDYENNSTLIQSRAKDKITALYKGLPVDVIFVGGE